MTQYDFSMVAVPDEGTYITLVELESKKEVKFFLKGNYNERGLTSHMNSLTDSLCEQWFDEALSVEERKAKQKLRKEQARKEREEIEARVAAQKEAAALAKKAEKEAARARRAGRN